MGLQGPGLSSGRQSLLQTAEAHEFSGRWRRPVLRSSATAQQSPEQLPAARGLFQKGLGQPHMLLLALTFAVFASKADTPPMLWTSDKAQGGQVARPLTRNRWTRTTCPPPMSQRLGLAASRSRCPRPPNVPGLTRGGGFSGADWSAYGVYGPGFGLLLPQLLDMKSGRSSGYPALARQLVY